MACVACSDHAADVGVGLRQLHLAPWGDVESTNGRFLVDELGSGELIAAFEKHGASVPIDVEHETLPGKAPATGSRGAVGWIEKVYAEPGRGLFALVRWSDKGREAIRSDAFRYVSPAFWIRKVDRRAVGLDSAALCTKPAIPQGNMERLAASRETTEQTMNTDGKVLLELSKALSLSDGADLVACRDALVKRLDQGKRDTEVAAAVRERLKLAADAGKAEVLLALSLSVEGNASAELTAMRAEAKEREAVELVDGFAKRNLITPAQRGDALALARESPDRLVALLKNAVPVAPLAMSTAPPNARREQIIRKARSEFQENPAHSKATDLRPFVNQSLRDAGLTTLSNTEARELMTA